MYNRDKYHKRILAAPKVEEEKPASVLEPLYKTSDYTETVKKGYGYENWTRYSKKQKR